jgi:hypothetical protein
VVEDVLISDFRMHYPPPPGWVASKNSAPLWWRVEVASSVGAHGSSCSGYIVVNVRTEGTHDGCTRLTLITTWAGRPDRTTTAIVNNRHIELAAIIGDPEWGNANEVYFKVEKICGSSEMIGFRLEERIPEHIN